VYRSERATWQVVCCLAAGGCAQLVEVSNLCGRIRISKEDMAAPCTHHPLEQTQHNRINLVTHRTLQHTLLSTGQRRSPQCCGSRIGLLARLCWQTHLADRPPLAVVAAQRMHADPACVPSEYSRIPSPSGHSLTAGRLRAHSIPSEYSPTGCSRRSLLWFGRTASGAQCAVRKPLNYSFPTTGRLFVRNATG
jgi:hypothetical protein